MRRLFVLFVMLAGLLALTPAARAAPALSVSGSCADPVTVPDAFASRFTGTLTDYQFVQLGETEVGLTGTLTGTCELLILGGGTVFLPFSPQQVTLADASWSLDCRSHQFSYGVSAVTIVTQGTMWVAAGGSTTLAGTSDQQNRDICKTQGMTMSRNTAVVVQALNDLLADF